MSLSEQESATRPVLRRLLETIAITDSILDAFLIDHFLKIKKNLSKGMDRTAKLNALLEEAEPADILLALQKNYPAEVKRALSDPNPADLFKPGDDALLVEIEREVTLPAGLTFDHKEQVPPFWNRKLRKLLHAASEDDWAPLRKQLTAALARLAHGRSEGQCIHIFQWAPHSAALLLGRLLDEMCRNVPLIIYQADEENSTWSPFSVPASRLDMPLRTERFFKKMEYEKVDTVADGKSVLVSLEVTQDIDSGTLWATAERVNAPYLYRITPVVPLGKIKTLAQAKAAVEDMDAAFRSLHTEHQSAPIHLVTTAPVALLVELGLRLRSNVYGGKIFIHHYDSNSMWYHPILNVMTQQVYSLE